jgi:hypothetical protein
MRAAAAANTGQTLRNSASFGPRVPEDPIMRSYRRRRIIRPTSAISTRAASTLEKNDSLTSLSLLETKRIVRNLHCLPTHIFSEVPSLAQDLIVLQRTINSLYTFWSTVTSYKRESEKNMIEVRHTLRKALDELSFIRQEYEVLLAQNEILREEVCFHHTEITNFKNFLNKGDPDVSRNIVCTETSEKVCTICYSYSKNVVLVPCNHFMCASCTKRTLASDTKKCPFCRGCVLGWLWAISE